MLRDGTRDVVELSIIIVNWNTREMLRQCLEAVYGTVVGLDYEVWVVDNASRDGSAAMVREAFPRAQVIVNNENLGFARANNQALEKCSGRYMLLLNSDAYLTNGAVDALVQALEADFRAGIAGARLVCPDGRAQRSYGRLPSLLGEVGSLLGLDKWKQGRGEKGEGRRVKEVGMVSGACILVRRAMLDEIGLLDERFFMFSEEVDLCKRASMAGWKVVHVAGAIVVHVGGGSSGLTSRRVLQLYRAKLQYFHKYHGQRLSRALFIAMRGCSRFKAWFYSLFNGKRAAMWREVSLGMKL
jgi:N-acetylglucosaminyl-diphospho-decaprenol L-rhamnosyltransferase